MTVNAMLMVLIVLVLIAIAIGVFAVLSIRWNAQREKEFYRLYSEAQRQTQLGIAAGQERSQREMAEQQRELQQAIADQQELTQRAIAERQDERLRALDENFSRLRQENARQIENIRMTVDEKLQRTLDEKLSRSFSLVNEQLEQVYRGLGEMQQVAESVGDLKKILSNVKTRGILGEVQLGAILEQILSPEQYEENVVTRPGSAERVEFAIRLPGENRPVYLPVDAKFPGTAYANLLDAYEAGDKTLISVCRKKLLTTIAAEAKDIHDKYIEVPYTTDFAVMFLPFEGLYAEVIRDGMIEMLQRRYKVTIAGPTTMAALLNSLQMGFSTLAIEKRSLEVWHLLAAVRSEFDNFEAVLASAQQRINQANDDLDKLVGVRTRQIQRKLRKVSELELPEQDTGI